MLRQRWRMAIRKAKLCFMKRSYPWVQLAGHDGGFKQDVDPHWILKLGNEYEKAALVDLKGDALQPFVPRVKGVVVNEGREFIQMENLLNGFTGPWVMDCKIGVRTFLERDVESKERRMDLLGKMLEIDPSAATEEEREDGITKLRYMQYRDALSSTTDLGFRIEAIRAGAVPDKNLKHVQTRAQVLSRFRFYLNGRADVKAAFLARLAAMRAALDSSSFFKTHEVIGSSLLFVSDAHGHADVRIIDFGKTITREHPNHTDTWDPHAQNHADGYLIGFANLVSLLVEA